MNKKYYLAKNSQISGPFREEDLQALERSGQIFSYTWIWRDDDKLWKALDPAPLNNPEDLSGVAIVGEQSKDVYCLYAESILKGEMRNCTELGCELIIQESSSLPPVGNGMFVQLLQQNQSPIGRVDSMKIVEMAREDSEWVLYLRHK